ncbi:MAG: hypothetical protein LBR11_12970 [Deltaproteobacteria bacterium]|nr:hypothetical protein [Deltaproteobacteria bacterium]
MEGQTRALDIQAQVRLSHVAELPSGASPSPLDFIKGDFSARGQPRRDPAKDGPTLQFSAARRPQNRNLAQVNLQKPGPRKTRGVGTEQPRPTASMAQILIILMAFLLILKIL